MSSLGSMLPSNKKLPKYYGVQENLRYRILNGEWKPGDQILTETELCEVYNVSRITIRKAILELTNEGLLYRQSGKGTFVKQPNEGLQDNILIKSFTNEMRERGKNAISLSVDLKVVLATKVMASLLTIKPGEPVIELRRIRAVNQNEIVAYSINTFPFTRDFSTNPQDYYQSFYEYLGKFGIFFSTAREYLESILPSPEIAQKLEIKPTEPVLKSVKVSHTSGLEFSEHNLCYYIGSKYRYYVNY
ncbi:MAG: GntR family transcriptional regulator [Anaerolineaceae bacterium]|nr:GntR family transcriptional regulator [Anaerolineaceae bacterium]